MQIIFLPSTWTILLCFILWPVLQLAAAHFCHHLPDRVLSPQSWFFRPHIFEHGGRIYEKIFRVSSWKHLLPDGNIAAKQHRFQKKHLKNFSEENLNRFLVESARAELTHWLAIPFFWMFGFFVPAKVIWYMLVYALLANLPCIIAQRYNRPRVKRLLNIMKRNVQTEEHWISGVTVYETDH